MASALPSPQYFDAYHSWLHSILITQFPFDSHIMNPTFVATPTFTPRSQQEADAVRLLVFEAYVAGARHGWSACPGPAAQHYAGILAPKFTPATRQRVLPCPGRADITVEFDAKRNVFRTHSVNVPECVCDRSESNFVLGFAKEDTYEAILKLVADLKANPTESLPWEAPAAPKELKVTREVVSAIRTAILRYESVTCHNDTDLSNFATTLKELIADNTK